MSNKFRYTNEECPICQSFFQENDDIVVCPLCGTPHHRECYNKNGECANNEKHRDGYRWESTATTQPTETPDEANEALPLDSPLGNNINNSQNAPSTVFFGVGQNPFNLYPKNLDENVTTEEAAEFIQASPFKYLKKFFALKEGKRTFNWAAFLFAPYWFFYRKLHKIGAIFLALFFVVSVAFSFIPSVEKLTYDLTEWEQKYAESIATLTEEEAYEALLEQKEIYQNNSIGLTLLLVQSGITFILRLFAGFKANKWYYDYTVETIQKLKTEVNDKEYLSNEDFRRLQFFKSGGISTIKALLAAMAYSTAAMAINMIYLMINK